MGRSNDGVKMPGKQSAIEREDTIRELDGKAFGEWPSCFIYLVHEADISIPHSQDASQIILQAPLCAKAKRHLPRLPALQRDQAHVIIAFAVFQVHLNTPAFAAIPHALESRALHSLLADYGIRRESSFCKKGEVLPCSSIDRWNRSRMQKAPLFPQA